MKYIYVLLVLFLFSSCSLVKFESEQIPLSRTDLNIRLLTQDLVRETSNKIEYATDSLMALTSDKETKINLLRWRINTLSEFKKVGFQTTPKLALLDTWSFLLQNRDFFERNETNSVFKDDIEILEKLIQQSTKDITKIARNTLGDTEFKKLQGFVTEFAAKNPISFAKSYHTPIRDEYYKFKSIDDSLAVKTVGTLSEVVADLSNKLTYSSSLASKQVGWNTELLLLESGLDSLAIDSLQNVFNQKLERFISTIENTPENLDSLVINFRDEIGPLFTRLDYSLRNSVETLGEERVLWDSIIQRERAEYYKLFMRERAVVTEEVSELSKDLLDSTMLHIKSILSNILIYLILLLAVIIFIPFGLGYFTGKMKYKNKGEQ
ncbi:hypothetical protein [Tenacibaculum sp. SG-28]|uniref:hypothetical protein n=1 Tax=Tenacibaculum sp. SG-28 TaxID=754426 RepID=UPI000CF3B1DE|nr:hypothetical protein [Tenacibaculum sp. SG-28]PQJ19932.1 hypothetical protein BSU00_11500 [Tenacibaculum sp. SG-28]